MQKKWIPSGHIKSINGAHKPGTYLARAYLHQKKHGSLPEWAKKAEQHDPNLGVRTGDWIFDRGHIENDAAHNLHYISPKYITRELGVSRRTVQNWMDAGHMGEVKKVGELGERRVLRSEFERARPQLEQRIAQERDRTSPNSTKKPPTKPQQSGLTINKTPKSKTHSISERNKLISKILDKYKPPKPSAAEKRRAMTHPEVERAMEEISDKNGGEVIRHVSAVLRDANFSEGAISDIRRELIKQLRGEIEPELVHFDSATYSHKLIYSEAMQLKSGLLTSISNGHQTHQDAFLDFQKFIRRSGLPKHTREDLEDSMREDLGIDD